MDNSYLWAAWLVFGLVTVNILGLVAIWFYAGRAWGEWYLLHKLAEEARQNQFSQVGYTVHHRAHKRGVTL